MRARWRRTAVAAAASGLTIGLMATGTGMAGGSAQPPRAPDRDRPSGQLHGKQAPASGGHRVTLITGDRVTLTRGPDKRWRASVEPGKGRKDVSFRTYRNGDQHYVIPSDVAALVAKGTLDRRLFDVALLAADKYDDRATKTIPLIVTYRGRAGRSAVKSSGADQTRSLPSINGAAVRVDKKETAGFLASVGGLRAEARLAAGIEKVWLDGVRRPLLEQSVPQIGAPAAWEAGFTGEGVKVAVLDGGVEATHPDLTGQVAETKNFTESPDGDPDGHGTHVAGTVAGTGSASDGRRTGVAPDAEILAGKVCEDGGYCLDSAILAGMEWAATEKNADVINMSLGGTDTPGIDPLEEAVNTLTEQTGALFVIAAGNEGPATGTVGSPGSADAALTVGAVDKSHELADFSSRGPRVGDGGIKPDITAPGVDIIAAKSENAWIGEPVDDVYMRLSGTSMASPHVAGAAALLAQQHPDWEAVELKAALMGSAKQHPDQSVFEQGAGRVDVAKAIKQKVFATTPSVSFGTARWPHDDDTAITRTVTFSNTGNADVTLKLAATLAGPDGQAAPDGSITLSATEVNVPAGGQAGIEVTANTRHDGPDGAYSGQITATAVDGTSLAVPVGVDKEVESYDLTLSYLGPDGEPAEVGSSTLFGLDVSHQAYPWSEAPTVRLPRGRYHLDTTISPTDGSSLYQLVQPVLTVNTDTTIVVDARIAKPVSHSVPQPDAVRTMLDLETSFTTAGGRAGVSYWILDPEAKVFTRSVGEARPDEEFVGSIGSHWWSAAASGGPAAYAQVDYRPGRYLTGSRLSPRTNDFATVVSTLRAPGLATTGYKGFYPVVPGSGGSAATLFDYQLPATATQHLYGAPEVEWFGELLVGDLLGEGWATNLDSATAHYRAGKTYRDQWNGAVLGLAARGMSGRHTGHEVGFSAAPYVDSAGNVPWAFHTRQASTKLYRNGRLLAGSSGTEVFAEDVPTALGSFRLELSAVRDPAVSGPLSTRIDSIWRFRSAAGAEPDGDVLPLWAVRYQPKVDGFNAMKRRSLTRLPIRVESLLAKDAARLRKVVIEVSGDDGKTWRKAIVTRTGDGRYLAVFKTPKGESVSLRASVADKAGNTAKQTIIAAYLLR